MSDLTDLLEGESPEIVPTTRIEKYLAAAIDGSGIEGLPAPVSNVDYLLLQLINVLSGGGGASGGLKCLKYESTATPTGGETVTFPVDFVMPQNWKMLVVQSARDSYGRAYSFVFTSENISANCPTEDGVFHYSIAELPTEQSQQLVISSECLEMYDGTINLTNTMTDFGAGYTVTVFYED